MKLGRLMSLAGKFRPLVFLALIFFYFSSYAQTYDPTKATPSNKPYGSAQAFPTEARSYFYDGTNFLWRPYQNISEVKSFLNLSKYRVGQFIIVVDSGGVLQPNGSYIGGVNNLWMFKDGTGDGNLVELNLFGSSGCVGCLLASNNLSDLANAATARTNLGLGTMATQNIAAGGDLSGNWNNISVSKFNGQLPSFYLNYLNLTNVPAIPPQLNLTTLGLISQSGVYPNISITGQTPGFEQTLLKLNTTSQVDSINIGTFIFRVFGTSALGLPRGNTAQRPSSPSVGDSRYNTDSLFVESWNGSAWTGGTGGGGGGGGITAGTGDVTFSGSGSVVTTLATVNSNVFGSNTFLKFAVNGKGLTTSATAVVSGDITGALGFTPYNATNPNGYIPLTALSATTPLFYNNTTGVFTIQQGTTSQNGYISSTDWNTFNGKQASGSYITSLNTDIVATGPGAAAATIQPNAVTTGKINNAAVTYAKIQSAVGSSVLLGAQSPGVLSEITLGTNLSMSGGVLNATTAGAQTLTWTQNATNNNLAISGGNSQNFLPATPNLAGLLDTARARYIDSAKGRLITFSIGAVSGLSVYGTTNDSFALGGNPLLQNTAIPTAGFTFSITGLPNKSSALGTDSLLIENLSGQMFKLPIVTGGITQLTGPVTAGPGSGSQATTIITNAIATAMIQANAVTLPKLSTGPSNQLIGFDGSGNPADIVVGTGLALSGSTLTSTGGLASIANFTYLGVSNLTGSSAVPVAINQQVYNVLDYGIKNDSSADITALLQALINFVPKGSKIWFPAGRYRQDHCDTITKSLTLEGSQPQIVQEYSIAGNPYRSVTCGIWHGTAGDSSFYVNSTEVTIRNLAFVNSNATQGTSTSRGIYYQQAANTVFENNSVYFFGRNFEIKNGGQYYIEHNEFMDATGDDDVLLQDSAQHDEGDGFFEHNYVVQFSHNITNQVEYRSGGGIHFNYNKGNALHHATAFFYAPFVGTIITECIGNGSEQCNGPEFWVKLANSSSTLNILKIQNNYMDGSGLGGHIVVDGSANGTGIQAYNISGNILSMGVADTGIVLNGVHFGGVGNNVFYGGKLKVVTLGSANQSNNMGFLALDQIQTLAETSGNINMELFSGTIGYITATGNDTLVLIAPKPGGSPFEVRYTQDATGGHTLRCQGFGEVWTGAGLGGYELIGVDPRPLHVTIIKGFVNANGAATITSINKAVYAGGIKYLDATINGESTDSTFLYLAKRLRIGFSATVNDYGTTIQDFGAFAQNKDSLPLVPNTTGSINMLAYDTVTHKYERAPVPTSGSSISLTTTGSSGAATLSGGVLNIPIYSGGGGGTPIGGDQATQYDSAGSFSGNNAVFISDYTNRRQFVTGNTAATTIDGLVLNTANVATTGAPKWSPRLRLTGNDWTGAASHPIDWWMENKTANGADQGNLAFSYSINGAAAVQVLSLTSGGFMDYNANSQTLGLVIRSSAGGNYTNIGNETISSVVQGFMDVNSTPSATAGIHFKDDGSIGLGTNNLVSRLSMYKSGSTYSLGNNGLSGVLLNGAAWTYNDNSTAPSGTVVQTAISAFGIPTITATNTGVVYTNVSTLYIAGDPLLSTNVTGTNKYAFNIASGHFFDNALTGIGTIPIATTNLALAASTAGVSAFNIAAGTPVTSPLQGDFYATTGHLFYRDQSTTYDFLALSNFYTTDGTLTSNRTVTGGSFSLTLGSSGSNLSALTVHAPIESFDGTLCVSGAGFDSHVGLSLPASTTTSVPVLFTNGVDITTPSNGYMWYNNTNLYFAQSSSVKVDLLAGIRNYQHNISTPTTGGTVNLTKNQYNIINPSGTLVALTVNLPSSPANNDVVYVKYTQAITTVTYGNGTVVDGITAPTAGGLVVLTFDSGSSSWY